MAAINGQLVERRMNRMRKNVNSRKKSGRPAGSVTRFKGLHQFAREMGVTPVHAHLVLAGKRESRRLINAWRHRAV
jgi:hypothetical protein